MPWLTGGDKNFSENAYFSLANVTDYVTDAFPPSFISTGNADPLLGHPNSFLGQRTFKAWHSMLKLIM